MFMIFQILMKASWRTGLIASLTKTWSQQNSPKIEILLMFLRCRLRIAVKETHMQATRDPLLRSKAKAWPLMSSHLAQWSTRQIPPTSWGKTGIQLINRLKNQSRFTRSIACKKAKAKARSLINRSRAKPSAAERIYPSTCLLWFLAVVISNMMTRISRRLIRNWPRSF